MLQSLNREPEKLFKLDAFGATLSAIFLSLVLPNYHDLIGLNVDYLYFLATIPIGFLLYDLFCLYTKKTELKKYLTYIAVANSFYCLLTFSIIYQSRATVTILGWIYFVLEIFIILSLVFFQFTASKN